MVFRRYSIYMSLLFVLVVAVGLSLTASRADADEINDGVKIMETTDLRALSEESRNKDIPIVIMFSQPGCGYCTIVEESFLKPMLRDPDFKDKMIVRKINVSGYNDIRGFHGEKVQAADLATHYRAFVTPTLVFLGPQGEELSHRLVGMQNEYYYGGDLDNAVNQSLQRLRQQVALK